MKVINVVGAKPNFMKVAPILREMRKYPDVYEPIFVHSGQHYDYEMSKIFFDDPNLPERNKVIKEAMKILENGGKKENYPIF